jgi:hypothetical protein
MNNQAARNYAYRPSPRREDLRYGDVHLQRGGHPFYGPDQFALAESAEKPALESHGFYLVPDDGPDYDQPRGFWARLKARFIGERLP